MRFKILSFSVLMAVSLTATAQQPGGRRGGGGDPAQRAEMQTQLMVDSLSLSAKQAEKVKAINLSFAEKQKAARANNQEGDWEKMRATMDSLRNEHNAELKTVLTAEQYNHWLMVAERQFKGRGPGGNNPPPPPPPADGKERKEKTKGRKDKDSLPPPPPPPPPPAEGGGN